MFRIIEFPAHVPAPDRFRFAFNFPLLVTIPQRETNFFCELLFTTSKSDTCEMTRRRDTRKARQPPEFIPFQIEFQSRATSEATFPSVFALFISTIPRGKRLHDTAAKVALAISMAIRDNVPGSAKSNYVPRTVVILMRSLPTAIQRSSDRGRGSHRRRRR
jgi:hypothetical protein